MATILIDICDGHQAMKSMYDEREKRCVEERERKNAQSYVRNLNAFYTKEKNLPQARRMQILYRRISAKRKRRRKSRKRTVLLKCLRC